MRTYRSQYLLRGPKEHQGEGYYIIRLTDAGEEIAFGPYPDEDQAERIVGQFNGRIARAVEQLARNSEFRRQPGAGV